jgi:hypothetical protein
VYGEGNVYDYGFRIYNPRIGKFLSVDPLTKEYPWYTPYQFAGNTSISAVDLDGLEELIVIKWYDNDQYAGETVVRIPDPSQRVDPRNGTALYINMDLRDRDIVNQELQKGQFGRFLDINNHIVKQGFIAEFRNKLDAQRNEILKNREEHSLYLNGAPSLEVYFEESEAILLSEIMVNDKLENNDKVISAMANFAKNNPDYELTVLGYTNPNNMSRSYDNNKLSNERAQNVAQELSDKGITVPSGNIKGNGVSNNPRESNEKKRKAVITATAPKRVR